MSTSDLHPLIRRQVRLHLDRDVEEAPELRPLLDAVGAAYEQFDRDRRMIERSLELSSNELLQANSEVRAVLQAFPDVVCRLDTSGRIIDLHSANPDDPALSHAAAGRPLVDCVGDKVRDRFAEAITQAEGSPCPVTFEYRVDHPGGTTYHEARLLRLPGDQVLCLVRNVTQRMHMEARLTQAQKLESIGQLAAGVAHEINTPTQFVTDNIRFLKDAFDELTRVAEAYEAVVDRLARGEGVDEELARVESLTQELDLPFLREEVPAAIVQSLEGLDRVARIVSAMKGFTHPGSMDKTLVDVNQVITDSMTVSRNEWKYVAALTTDLAPDLPLVSGYPAELHQVVLNLIVNAAHAVQAASAPGEASGQIEVSTRAVENGVEVTVHDSGGGVPEAIRGRIFDPFFTTKDVGKGTGQGLAIAHAIVTEMHGGELLLDATDTPGATFRIRLPLRQPTRQAVAA